MSRTKGSTGVESQATFDRCRAIVEEYTAQGFRLTVRQVYYQIVSRFPDLQLNTGAQTYPATRSTYMKVQQALQKGRESGAIPYEAIEDRSRTVDSLPHWEDISDRLNSAAASHRLDLWANQEYRPEIWTEKQAVFGIVLDLQEEYDLACYSCRGFDSLSKKHEAEIRLTDYVDNGQTPIVFYFGDCDPSGNIMDKGERGLQKYVPTGAQFKRVAITINQARERNLPPIPAKESDTRTTGYIAKNGSADCWEVDALPPDEIQRLIRESVEPLIDRDLWDKTLKRQVKERARLREIAATH